MLTDVTVGAGGEGGGRGRGRGRGRGAASSVETRHMADILSSLLVPHQEAEGDAAGSSVVSNSGLVSQGAFGGPAGNLVGWDGNGGAGVVGGALAGPSGYPCTYG